MITVAPDDSRDPLPLQTGPKGVRMVGLGASAGGLEAIKQFFGRMATNSSMAFVVVQHLDPEYPSMLQALLASCTTMPVLETASGMTAEANHVYLIPSDSDLYIERGVFELRPRQLTGRLHLPIDTFFRSMAEDCHECGIGVVLSGSGADGSEGLRTIKAEGGIAFAQAPDSAKYRSMPESAIATGVVDFCGTPEEIADELSRLHQFSDAEPHLSAEQAPDVESSDKMLDAVFEVLRVRASTDFSGYKRTTAMRRIGRRMALRHVQKMGQYLKALQDDPDEAKALARDMLIHVTSFFRDAKAFAALKDQALSELVKRKADGESVRLWVPGCSTGEEAYSLAISLIESFDAQGKHVILKVFGTDLSEETVETARRGRYTEEALVDVSTDHVARFFERDERGYRIAQRVRDACVFVRHDLTRDPPFAKLDLISCRNVLIYFDADLQRRLIPMLHYCLNPHGYLFLGQSETIAGFSDIFAPLDKGRRIFVKTGRTPPHEYPTPRDSDLQSKKVAEGPLVRPRLGRDVFRQADHFLLARYAPAAVVIDERLEILEFRGRTGDFLEPPPGQPQSNLLRMARDGLIGHLHEVIARAKSQHTSARRPGVRVETASQVRIIDIEVVPLAGGPDGGERHYLVLFEEGRSGALPERPAAVPPTPSPESQEDAERLKMELVSTKDYLQSLLSEHQGIMDALAATNDELLAANEELQSTNEELQSAKEELQSTNEELSTVNDQLRSRNLELDEIASDLANVLASVEIPVIIVDLEHRVRRFTPTAKTIASCFPEDIGRSIDDIKLKVTVENIGALITEVIHGLVAKEWDVEGIDGRWFRMQVRPYYAPGNRLDGAVLAFVDVSTLRQARTDAETARDYATSIVEAVVSALVVVDSRMLIVSANAAFMRIFGVSAPTAIGKSILDIDASLSSALCHRVPATTAKDGSFVEEIVAETRDGRRVLVMTGRSIAPLASDPFLLVSMDDVTDLRALEAERANLLESEKQSRLSAERANRAKDLFLATLSHELRTPLTTMLLSTQLLGKLAHEDSKIARASATIERAVNAQSKLIDDLLDVSRIVSGKLLLDLSPVDIRACVENAVEVARLTASSKSVGLELVTDKEIGTVCGDPLRLQQVVTNLLNNAIKFTGRGGRVSVHLARYDNKVKLTVSDTGVGISADMLPHVFDRFIQGDSTVTRRQGGLGLGLSIVRHLVTMHGGEVGAESQGEGKGATFCVTLPLGGSDVLEAEPASRTSVRDIAGIRILLVEDDDGTREACVAMLQELGAEVWASPSAADGLVAVTEFRPQVILSDIAMPGEDGLSFIQRVRQLSREEGGAVPAAALSALAHDDDRKRAIAAGFDMQLAKPIDSARMVVAIGKLMDKAQSVIG
jgi:two-component system CheB/CheR fusion protein